MIYSSRVSISKEQLEFSNLDLMEYSIKDLFAGMLDEFYKNLKGEVQEKENEYQNTLELDLRLVVFSQGEYANMIKHLREKISHLPTEDQASIMKIFREDEIKYLKNPKVYI